MNETVVAKAYARAGLLGNPSDGYNGKAIALTVRNFAATVRMEPSRQLTIRPSVDDLASYPSLDDFSRLIEQRGYYGGLRLLKATIKFFVDYCRENDISLHSQNFSISYDSNIPRSVGLAGSSAIVTATLKALVRFYQVDIAPGLLASIALVIERDGLGISAGLMDRVIQVMEGVVYMDFSPEATQTKNGLAVGQYQPLPVDWLANRVYVAWADRAAEPTEVLHNRLRERFRNGDQDVVNAMAQFAALAESGKQAILDQSEQRLSELIDANFDLRMEICELPQLHRQMVATARSAGGSAKFCGSGGAIIGTCTGPEMFDRIHASLNSIGCQVARPEIITDGL